MDKKQMVMAVVLLCAAVFGLGYKTGEIRQSDKVKPVMTTVKAGETERAKARTVTVHITGAVKKPGVYTLPEGSRMIDGVNKAGPARDADLNSINLAETLTDELPVYVPRQGEAAVSAVDEGGPDSTKGASLTKGAARTGGRSSNAGRITGGAKITGITARSNIARGGKININTATTGELDSLKGIGPALAERIIDYRKQHGRFKSVSELREVSGIGEKKFADLKEQISV